MNSADFLTALTRPYERHEVLRLPSPVPASPGIYGWFFRSVPSMVPTAGSVTLDGLTLLYVGIAPSRAGGRRTLRQRIGNHFRGPADTSTLRFTLGSLLREELGLKFERSLGGRLTFGAAGELRLSEWMAANALVGWAVHDAPWEVEHDIIRSLPLPLNIDANSHPFARELRGLRADARNAARD